MGQQLLCGAQTATGSLCAHPRRKGAADCGRHDRTRTAMARPNLVFVDTAGSDPLTGAGGGDPVAADPAQEKAEWKAARRAAKVARRDARARFGLRDRDLDGIHVSEPDGLGIRQVTLPLAGDPHQVTVTTRVRDRNTSAPVPLEAPTEALRGGYIEATRPHSGERETFTFTDDSAYDDTIVAAREWATHGTPLTSVPEDDNR